jgi:hypothetical protein
MPPEAVQPSTPSLNLSQLLRLHGEASAAMLLLLVSLLSLTPLLGVSLLILLIAPRWHRPDLAVPIPARLAGLPLGESWSSRLQALLAFVQRLAKRWLRERWILLLAPATHQAWGCWIGAMGLLLLLPLPLANVLPALSLALLSLAWVARDGLALAVSTALGAAGLGYVLLMSNLLLVLAQDGLMWLRSAMAGLVPT